METNKKERVWIPLLMAGCVVIGLFIGALLSRNYTESNGGKVTKLNKLSALINLIETKYVDSVDVSKLTEDLIPMVMQELDPHSVYISADERKMTDEQLDGSFSGIGVQFRMMQDTIFVTDVIKGGPADRVGLMDGDRIVTIEGANYTGKKINTDDILKKLRGKKGSAVKIGVLRHGSGKLKTYSLTRDDIPVYSINARYKIGKDIGYIKINEFGRNAHTEFLNAVAYLKHEGCSRFIIDLRDNHGGLMEPALNIANEFLPDNRLILYTKGHSYPREDVYSNGKGTCQTNPVVIMIDEGSASSSEILAGALQDNDRASIVGRRSFGKGLVQEEIPFRDGSAVRLTIARFYIPSGRCIQKPYKKGADDDYDMDIVKRYEKGELSSINNIHFPDSLRFKTTGGRTVYGGGGIMPDYFVPLDIAGYTAWYAEALNNGFLYGFAFDYTIDHMNVLKSFKTADKLASYLDSQDLVNPFISYAAARGLRGRPDFIYVSFPFVINDVKSNIAHMMLGENAFWMIYQKDDPALVKSIRVVSKSKHIVTASLFHK